MDSVPSEYINRLTSEIRANSDEIRPCDTIYFGGGTPSILSPDQLEKVFDAVNSSFSIEKGAEITLEVNPGTVDKKKLSAFRSLGVTRLSIGLQSTHKDELSALGRIHTYDEFLECYSDARTVGFDNINLDLMYGIPHMTASSFRETLDRVTELSPEHLSLYGLILEEGTPLHRMKDTLPFPTEDAECDMYFEAAKILRKNGYSHYEISNYAKPGYESRHNLKYWSRDEYIGFGASAASYYGGKQLTNTHDINEYIFSSEKKYESEEPSDGDTLAFEYAMLRLRLKDGILLSEYKRRFGRDFAYGREQKLRRLADLGLAVFDLDRFCLTEQGFYVSNSILTEIL